MKNILLLMSLLLMVFSIQAQVDRTKAPEPAAAREIKIGDYQRFTLKNGLQVFVIENHKLPRVQFSIQLKNDPILEGDKAGYTDMAGTLMGTGTKTKTKAQLDEATDFIGANLSTSSNSIFASSLTKHSAKLLDLMSDVLHNPAFSAEEMEKLKIQTLSGLAAGKDDPNTIIGNVRRALVYGKNHTYGEMTTEKTVGAITLEDCKNYYNTFFKPNNAYLIIVGDIDLKTAKSLSEKYFDKWLAGEVKNPTYPIPQAPSKTIVALVDRPSSVQSVINVAYPVEVKTGTQDAIKARVANQILGGSFSARLMQNLREKHAYTYGSSSSLNPDNLIGNFNATASVRNAVTDSSVNELMNELKKIANEPATESELASAKASISGAFGRSLESPQTIAGFALNTAKYNLPKDYYNNYLKYIDAVTVADVQASSKKFIRPDNAYIIVVGKGAEIADKLKRFGELKYYDINGDSYVPSKTIELPAGLTAEKVIANYLDAIGGLKKIQEVKTVKTIMKANFQGTELTSTTTKKSPGMSLMEISVMGIVMQKSVTDGKESVAVYNGQKVLSDAASKEWKLFDAYPVPETMLGVMKVEANLKSVEVLDGKEAFVVEYLFLAGEKITVYFDKETGLKVQMLQTVKGPQGEVIVPTKYQNYKEVNGLKFPHTILISSEPMNSDFQVFSLEVNVPVENAVFKVD